MSEQGDVTGGHQREKLSEELLHSQGQLQEGLLDKKDDKSNNVMQQKAGEMHQMGQSNNSNQNASNLASQQLVTHLPVIPQGANFSFPLQLLQQHNNPNAGQHGLVSENFLDQDPNRMMYGQAALQQLFLKKIPPNKQDSVVGSPNATTSPGVDPLKKKGRGGKRAGAGRKRKRQDAPGSQTMNSVSSGDPSALLNAGGLGHPASSSPNFKQLSSPQQSPVSPRNVGSTSSTLPASATLNLGLPEDETLKQLLQNAPNFNQQQAVHKQLKEQSGHESPSKQRRHEEYHKLEEEKTELESRYRDLNAVLTINANLNYGLTNRVKALEVQVKELQVALQNKEETERNLLFHKKELERKVSELETELAELKNEKK